MQVGESQAINQWPDFIYMGWFLVLCVSVKECEAFL